ncbi:MAG: phosphoesterase [Gemmatimonadales bacterium]
MTAHPADTEAATAERILVVPRLLLLTSGPFHGFHPGDAEDYVGRIRRHGEFRPRDSVEEDPTLKQIIPYLILRHGERIFLFQRSGHGSEPRLHGRVSIGVGGHVTAEDIDRGDLLMAGLRRELDEELIVAGAWTARRVGVLNDDKTPVGSVHFGVVYVVEIERPEIRVREEDRLTGRLAGSPEVRAVQGSMETWSQLILDAADPFTL